MIITANISARENQAIGNHVSRGMPVIIANFSAPDKQNCSRVAF